MNHDIYSNIHFVQTLETTDPISIDKDTIQFRKKYQPELYAKGQKSIKQQMELIYPQEQPKVMNRILTRGKSLPSLKKLNIKEMGQEKSLRLQSYILGEQEVIEYNNSTTEYQRQQERKKQQQKQQRLQYQLKLSAQDTINRHKAEKERLAREEELRKQMATKETVKGSASTKIDVEQTDRTIEYKQTVHDFEIMEEQRKLIQMKKDLEKAKHEKNLKDAKDMKLQLRKKLVEIQEMIQHRNHCVIEDLKVQKPQSKFEEDVKQFSQDYADNEGDNIKPKVDFFFGPYQTNHQIEKDELQQKMESIMEQLKPGLKKLTKRKVSKASKESKAQNIHAGLKDRKTSKSVAALKEKIAQKFSSQIKKSLEVNNNGKTKGQVPKQSARKEVTFKESPPKKRTYSLKKENLSDIYSQMADHDLNCNSQDEDDQKMFMKFDKEEEINQSYDQVDRNFLKRKQVGKKKWIKIAQIVLKTKKYKTLQKFLKDVKYKQEEIDEKTVTRSLQSNSPTRIRNLNINIKRKSFSQSSQESQLDNKSVIIPQKVEAKGQSIAYKSKRTHNFNSTSKKSKQPVIIGQKLRNNKTNNLIKKPADLRSSALISEIFKNERTSKFQSSQSVALINNNNKSFKFSKKDSLVTKSSLNNLEMKPNSKSQSNKNKSPTNLNQIIKEEKFTPLNQKNTKAVIGQNSKEKSWKEDIPIQIPQPERSLMNKDFNPYIQHKSKSKSKKKSVPIREQISLNKNINNNLQFETLEPLQYQQSHQKQELDFHHAESPNSVLKKQKIMQKRKELNQDMEEINQFIDQRMSADNYNNQGDSTVDQTGNSNSLLLFKLNSVYQPNENNIVSPHMANIRSQTIPVMNESDDKRREVETNVPGNWQRHSFDVSKVKKSRFISKIQNTLNNAPYQEYSNENLKKISKDKMQELKEAQNLKQLKEQGPKYSSSEMDNTFLTGRNGSVQSGIHNFDPPYLIKREQRSRRKLRDKSRLESQENDINIMNTVLENSNAKNEQTPEQFQNSYIEQSKNIIKVPQKIQKAVQRPKSGLTHSQSNGFMGRRKDSQNLNLSQSSSLHLNTNKLDLNSKAHSKKLSSGAPNSVAKNSAVPSVTVYHEVTLKDLQMQIEDPEYRKRSLNDKITAVNHIDNIKREKAPIQKKKRTEIDNQEKAGNRPFSQFSIRTGNMFAPNKSISSGFGSKGPFPQNKKIAPLNSSYSKMNMDIGEGLK